MHRTANPPQTARAPNLFTTALALGGAIALKPALWLAAFVLGLFATMPVGLAGHFGSTPCRRQGCSRQAACCSCSP